MLQIITETIGGSMENVKEAPSFFIFLWFLLKVSVVDIVVVFLCLLILKFFKVGDLMLSLILVVIGIVFFVAFLFFFFLWEQSKEIRKDDEEFARNQN